MKKKLDEPQSFRFPAIPNIPDLAARGGLRPTDEAVPFRLGAISKGDIVTALVMDAHGCNTLSIRQCASHGMEKYIFAARQMCVEHPEARDPEFINERYRESFGFMGLEWIKTNIIDRRDATDHYQMVRECNEKLLSYPTIGKALETPLPWSDTFRASLRPPQSAEGSTSVNISTLPMLKFRKAGGGVTVESGFTDEALLNTYDALCGDLSQARAFIQGGDGDVTERALKAHFKERFLSEVATGDQWGGWILTFGKENAHPGKVANNFLRRATGLKVNYIKKRCAIARAIARAKRAKK